MHHPACLLVLALALAPDGPEAGRRHLVGKDTWIEGRIERRGGEVRIVTPLGVRLVDPRDLGPSEDLTPLRERFEEARAALPPGHAAAHAALGGWCVTRGYLTGAVMAYDRALGIDPAEPAARAAARALAPSFRLVDNPYASQDGRRRLAEEVDLLVRALGEAGPFRGLLVAEQLSGHPADLTAQPLRRLAESGADGARLLAIPLLAPRAAETETRRFLATRALRDASAPVRQAAVRALMAPNTEPAGIFVRAFRRSSDGIVRVRAIEALGELRDPKTVPFLITAISGAAGAPRNHISVTRQTAYVKDYDVEVAQGAVIADPIVDVVQSGVILDVAVIAITLEERRACLAALRRITGASPGDSAAAWRGWYRDTAPGRK